MSRQKTIKASYSFYGKGLHTGVLSHITLHPADVNTGIRFVRTDLGPDCFIEAKASNVGQAQRCSCLQVGEARVMTMEHLLSTLWGLGVDNAIVEIDSQEVPILDGSARPYAQAILADGLKEQEAARKEFRITESIELSDPASGASMKIVPADEFSIDLTVDFGSKVMGVQKASFNPRTDYAKQIAPCRTFVFYHEIEMLFKNGLIKGGDLDNAIVIVEKPVPQADIDALAALIGKSGLPANFSGYLSHSPLFFPNECARHKLLDIMGDLSLCGAHFCGKITGYKTGHSLNLKMARLLQEKFQS